MKGLTVFFVSSGAISLLSFIIWLRNKKKAEQQRLWKEVLSSPDTSWKKVGKIKDIYYYPLKSGKGKSIDKCIMERYGIAMYQQGMFTMRDRMFLVYEEETGKFQTGRQYPELLLVNIFAIDKDRAKLEVNQMPELIFNLPKFINKNAKPVDCSMWFNEPVKCLDCGPEPAAWLSQFLKKSNSGLRLGMFIENSERDVVAGGDWEEHSKVYTNMRNEDAGLFSDLASYTLMSESSVADLNSRLSKPITTLQLRPNLVVEGCGPYAEDNWEWIRIGKEAIIRNFKLCPRCSMTRVDPDTGIPNGQWEPLKTLRSYRKVIKDPVKSKIDEYAPYLGLYCGLYRPGPVEVNDDVCVYQPNN